MTKQLTKAELLEENKWLKEMLKSTQESQMVITNSSFNLVKQHNKVYRRYNASINKIEREFNKKIQIVLLLILVFNTIILFMSI
jgi:hypothetical protein